jgi:TonB family protein
MSLITNLAHHWGAQWCALNVQVAIFVALACAIAFCFRRFPARYRYILWLLVLVRLAIPFPITSPWGIGQYPERLIASILLWIGGSNGTAAIQSGSATGIALSPPAATDSASLLFIIWISGMIVSGAGISARFLQLRRKAKNLVPVIRPDLISLLHLWSARLGLNRNIKLLEARNEDDIPFPAVDGIFRPSIVLPASMVSEWTADELEPVLLHELTHIRRRDGFFNLAQVVLQAVYFYHPMVWLANWAMRRERELACDDEVVRRYRGCPTEYVRSMCHAAETVVLRRRQLWGISMAESFSTLGMRIRRMVHRSYGANEKHGFICLCAIIVLGGFCAGVSCSHWENRERLAAGNQEDSEVFVVGKDVKPPVVLAQSLPSYTEEARKARAEGMVLLQAVIRKDGAVTNLKVMKGLGYGLDESAMNTITTQWRFKPGTRGDVPVNTQATIEVSYKLY